MAGWMLGRPNRFKERLNMLSGDWDFRLLDLIGIASVGLIALLAGLDYYKFVQIPIEAGVLAGGILGLVAGLCYASR